MKPLLRTALILSVAAASPVLAQQSQPDSTAPTTMPPMGGQMGGPMSGQMGGQMGAHMGGQMGASHGHMMMSGGDTSPSSQAFRAADRKMMHGMMVPLTGDADRDFAASMIPHHQGAIDMAKVELQYGKDPALRQLATDIVAAQEKEIALMKDWLAQHPAH